MKVTTLLIDPEKFWINPEDVGEDSENTLLTIFAAPSLFNRPDVFRDLRERFPKSKIVGCSTAGEIGGCSIHDDMIVGAIARFESTQLELASMNIDSRTDSFEAGASIARQLDRPDLRGIILFSDGLHVNGSKLVAGLNSVLPDSVSTSGGLAADGARFGRTWVLNDGAPETETIVAVGLYGESVRLRHGSKGGWDIFGPERVVTRSVDNELFELDGKPALELYRTYLGDRSAELPASALLFPLAVGRVGDENRVVRTVLGVNEERQSMIFAGDVAQGNYVQLMRANLDRLIDGAAEAAESMEIQDSGDTLSIAISCVGRRLILGGRAEEELEAVMEHFPPNVKQVGFYSYGEISPFPGGSCELHNQTMTLTLLSEV